MTIEYHSANLKYLSFGGFREDVEPNDDFLEDKGNRLKTPGPKWRARQMKLWASTIRETVTILPPQFVEELGELRFVFYINQYTWETAHPERNTVFINLLPSTKRPEWMTFETLSLNGFTREEIIFVALHEIAHVYSLYTENFINKTYSRQYSGISWWNGDRLEVISSIYCLSLRSWDNKPSPMAFLDYLDNYFEYGGTYFRTGRGPSSCFVREFWDWDSEKLVSFESEPTFYGRERGIHEDFADTFALYVMFPEYLKNFPGRYEVMEDILGKEYVGNYMMSGSLRSRSTFSAN